eukprot:TRINITY_DN9982_c0_g1_i1.p1 TRINITY_DN9982_c0_g1~~TRINITY_DN9982_c0_g1_i1.p1  ORF type:complete len:928 (-),score=229.21 TRINITY_DN9982_c0_g1_i1:797-3343(-)
MDGSTSGSLDDLSTGSFAVSSGSLDVSSTGWLHESSSGSLDVSSTGLLGVSTTDSLDDSSSGSLDVSSTGLLDDLSSGSLEGSSTGLLDDSSNGSLEVSSSGAVVGQSSGEAGGTSSGLIDRASSGLLAGSSSLDHAFGTLSPAAGSSGQPSTVSETLTSADTFSSSGGQSSSVSHGSSGAQPATGPEPSLTAELTTGAPSTSIAADFATTATIATGATSANGATTAAPSIAATTATTSDDNPLGTPPDPVVTAFPTNIFVTWSAVQVSRRRAQLNNVALLVGSSPANVSEVFSDAVLTFAYNWTGLRAQTTYFLLVRVSDAAGHSASSPLRSVTTPASATASSVATESANFDANDHRASQSVSSTTVVAAAASIGVVLAIVIVVAVLIVLRRLRKEGRVKPDRLAGTIEPHTPPRETRSYTTGSSSASMRSGSPPSDSPRSSTHSPRSVTERDVATIDPDLVVVASAIRIQAAFRGFLTRKRLELQHPEMSTASLDSPKFSAPPPSRKTSPQKTSRPASAESTSFAASDSRPSSTSPGRRAPGAASTGLTAPVSSPNVSRPTSASENALSYADPSSFGIFVPREEFGSSTTIVTIEDTDPLADPLFGAPSLSDQSRAKSNFFKASRSLRTGASRTPLVRDRSRAAESISDVDVRIVDRKKLDLDDLHEYAARQIQRAWRHYRLGQEMRREIAAIKIQRFMKSIFSARNSKLSKLRKIKKIALERGAKLGILGNKERMIMLRMEIDEELSSGRGLHGLAKGRHGQKAEPHQKHGQEKRSRFARSGGPDHPARVGPPSQLARRVAAAEPGAVRAGRWHGARRGRTHTEFDQGPRAAGEDSGRRQKLAGV